MQENRYCLRDIFFQESALAHLYGSYANGRIAQTYLFTGLRSTGRFRTALSFASLLQCENPVKEFGDGLSDACGECESCRRISAGSHPDVHVITPDGYEIRIDQVRAMQEAAALKPTMGKWLLFVLDSADRLNTYSANSLLKILEEAPANVVFILIAGGTSSVIPTILSRSEVVRFQVPSHDAARKKLAEILYFSDEQVADIYAWSEGQFGTSLSLAKVYEDHEIPVGISASHTAFLNALEGFSLSLQAEIDEAGSLDEALRIVARLEQGIFLPLRIARKEFCRALVMTAGLPAAFPLLFTESFTERIDLARKSIRKSFDTLMADAKSSYSAGMIKELDGQINAALAAWGLGQIEDLFCCLMNWYADALRWFGSKDETLLLNLNRKEDIITLAEVDTTSLLRSRIEMLEESVYLLRRYVQPSLVIENVLTQIGGPEA